MRNAAEYLRLCRHENIGNEIGFAQDENLEAQTTLVPNVRSEANTQQGFVRDELKDENGSAVGNGAIITSDAANADLYSAKEGAQNLRKRIVKFLPGVRVRLVEREYLGTKERACKNIHYLQDREGSTIGWYNQARETITLVDDLIPVEVLKENLAWFLVWNWVLKSASDLSMSLLAYANKVTADVSESVVKRYGEELSTEALIDEIATGCFSPKDMVRTTSDGAGWWKAIKNGIRKIREAFYVNKGATILSDDDARNCLHLSPKNAVEKIVACVLAGKGRADETEVLDYLDLCSSEDAWVDSGTGNMAWKPGRKKTTRRRPIDRLPRKTVQSIISANVSLIKTIPRVLHPEVAKNVSKVLFGRMEAEELVDWLIEETGVSEGRAYVIAIDQIRKAKERMKIADWVKRGIEYVVWRHRSTVKEPRKYHIANWDGHSGVRNGKPNGLNGFVFRLDNPPVIDKKSGQRGYPSNLIGCKCYLTPIKI